MYYRRVVLILMPDNLSITKTVSKPKPGLGEIGESLAANYLIQNGFRLVVANFKVPVGRNSLGTQVTGEIDLIALDAEVLCFIEVKTRRSAEFTPVLTNVGLRKQRQITKTARIYRRLMRINDEPFRYDVVSILLSGAHNKPKIELFRYISARPLLQKDNCESVRFESCQFRDFPKHPLTKLKGLG